MFVPVDHGSGESKVIKTETKCRALDSHRHEQYRWSDPFVFRADGKTFVTFKSSGGAVCVARNAELTEWRYVGSLTGMHGECPNFVKLGDKWVLLTSGSDRSQQLQYQVGTFDPHELEFKAEKRGVLDHSYGPKRPDSMCRGFYATNTLYLL